ncbi:SH3 domain-containing protein [Pseudonocardia hispaniensis]|uniref:SH3 domain-containing protein n=1 Tax=Pseudonocardia hispaniensis TaxID=904933 RepID=A0ABW1J097_9PSEU
MNWLQRPGRAAAVTGGLVAVGAATVMALAVGTASAAEQGRCTDTVNVRAEPSPTARIVAVCERGTEVTVGERRNGFVHLTNLHGWSAEQYVSTERSSRATPGGPAPTSAPASTQRRQVAPSATPTVAPTTPQPRPAPQPTPQPSAQPAPATVTPTEAPQADAPAPPAEREPARSPIGALIP